MNLKNCELKNCDLTINNIEGYRAHLKGSMRKEHSVKRDNFGK